MKIKNLIVYDIGFQIDSSKPLNGHSLLEILQSNLQKKSCKVY